MEAVTAGVEDYLIGNLSYKLAPGASYVNERKSSTFHTSGSNFYSPTGTKLIRIMLTGDMSWLDVSTVRIMFDLVNAETEAAKQLRPLSGPWTFFQRMRILVGNTLVEDIDDYNRLHEMMQYMMATDSRENIEAEGFGNPKWDVFSNLKDTAAKVKNFDDDVYFPGIPGNTKYTVLFKPLCGLFNQPKYIPLKYCGGITIELELVSDATEPIISFANTEFTTTNTSYKWYVENVQCKCDLLTLDNQLENSYAEHLLSGKTLPVNLNTYVSMNQSVNGRSIRVNVNRSFTRLKSVFVSFTKENTEDFEKLLMKSFNNFYSPLASSMTTRADKATATDIHNFQLQIGPKLYPEYPIRSTQEAYYQLRKTLGVQSSPLHSFDIKPWEYKTRKFILGTDTEKILEAGYTGLNTRAGDMLHIRLDNSSDTPTDKLPTTMYVVLHSDILLNISDRAVEILD